jgi:hypothetical protein
MADTRILDATIATLRGKPRKSRSGVIQVSVHINHRHGTYLIQVGSRIVADGTGTPEAAEAIANEKAAALRQRGKRAVVVVF